MKVLFTLLALVALALPASAATTGPDWDVLWPDGDEKIGGGCSGYRAQAPERPLSVKVATVRTPTVTTVRTAHYPTVTTGRSLPTLGGESAGVYGNA